MTNNLSDTLKNNALEQIKTHIPENKKYFLQDWKLLETNLFMQDMRFEFNYKYKVKSWVYSSNFSTMFITNLMKD